MNKYPSKLSQIKGLYFAITGRCWEVRKDLIRLIERKGGSVNDPRAQVSLHTNVLIRGSSSQWAYKKYGHKESEVARLLANGQDIVVVHDYDFKNLLKNKKPIKTIDRIAGQPVEWLLPAISTTKFKNIIKIEGPLDREHSVKGRLEQKFLREQLFGNKSKAKCSICGKNFPIEVMVAGHIKPRSECNIDEKRDFENIIFPICLLGCDTLYERGYVGVNEKGKVLTSNRLNSTKELKSTLSNLKNNKCLAWNEQNEQYFSWHLNRRFVH